MAPKKEVTIHTDGACTGNPGPGGYAAILAHGAHRKELSGGFRRTTNNRMELVAAIVGLRALKQECRVVLYSDSEYLVKAMTKGWAERWKSKGWRRNRSAKALNADLWAQLLELCQDHRVQFRWVRGHSGNLENERCDKLAVEAAAGADLPVDEGFERSEK
ncbi:MAG: ribonuclease HI [Acidobacteria bacterium]|nr:ribonuclease HI [Acidobacteriota bacterium]